MQTSEYIQPRAARQRIRFLRSHGLIRWLSSLAQNLARMFRAAFRAGPRPGGGDTVVTCRLPKPLAPKDQEP